MTEDCADQPGSKYSVILLKCCAAGDEGTVRMQRNYECSRGVLMLSTNGLLRSLDE